MELMNARDMARVSGLMEAMLEEAKDSARGLAVQIQAVRKQRKI